MIGSIGRSGDSDLGRRRIKGLSLLLLSLEYSRLPAKRHQSSDEISEVRRALVLTRAVILGHLWIGTPQSEGASVRTNSPGVLPCTLYRDLDVTQDAQQIALSQSSSEGRTGTCQFKARSVSQAMGVRSDFNKSRTVRITENGNNCTETSRRSLGVTRSNPRRLGRLLFGSQSLPARVELWKEERPLATNFNRLSICAGRVATE